MGTIKNYQERDKKAEYAYKFYLNKGYSPQASASIVGNLIHEGGLNTTAEGDKGYKGGSSRGIAQWREKRLRKLQSMYGEKWTDFDNQLEFVDWELNNTHKSAGEALKRANTVWEAGRIFTNEFERPKVKFDEDNRRQKNVTDTYKKYAKLELTQEDKNKFTPTFTKDVAPYMNINSEVSNFDIPIDSSTFASVPDVYKEETPTKEKQAIQELQQKEVENSFLEEYNNISVRQPSQEEQQQVDYSQPTDVIGIINQVTQFVDTPMQQGGIIKDNMGQWRHPGKVTEIASPNITMKGVGYPVIGISKETGEQKLMIPNLEYFFKNTKNVLEIPIR